ncbi:hypothetical protein PLICRDRAFT_154334 [Plicaturopsis crispa FD-325 SS-3]|nr:hypothetical protein PLICRDRAFT_154334 [Plicaturopsis crispa FD-325 SS-3]
MPFYQMLCIARHMPEYRYIKDLVHTSALAVMNAGGVVRGFEYWGTRSLPQRTHKQNEYHYRGDYWTMHFDTSPRVLKELEKILRQDNRVIRWHVTKIGDKVEDVVQPRVKTIESTGQQPWRDSQL